MQKIWNKLYIHVFIRSSAFRFSNTHIFILFYKLLSNLYRFRPLLWSRHLPRATDDASIFHNTILNQHFNHFLCVLVNFVDKLLILQNLWNTLIHSISLLLNGNKWLQSDNIYHITSEWFHYEKFHLYSFVLIIDYEFSSVIRLLHARSLRRNNIILAVSFILKETLSIMCIVLLFSAW